MTVREVLVLNIFIRSKNVVVSKLLSLRQLEVENSLRVFGLAVFHSGSGNKRISLY